MMTGNSEHSSDNGSEKGENGGMHYANGKYGTKHPYGRASWREKESSEVLEEVATNFPNFLASLLYFIWSNTRTIIITLFSNWTLLLRHPLSTIFRLLFVPVVSFAMLFAGLLFYFGRIFQLDLLLQKVSSQAYGGRSIANWGDTDVLNDPDIEEGLELMTSRNLEQPSEFNCKIGKALLFFGSVVYEDEGSFDDAVHKSAEHWKRCNLELLNKPGKVYCRNNVDAVGNFAALFMVRNTITKETAMVLSFRGTSPLDLNQWLIDCSMRKIDAHDYLFGAVHEGFYRTLFRKRRNEKLTFYQNLVRKIETIVAKYQTDNKPCQLWVTGHSLGAALASLFFARAIKTREIKNVILSDTYTFGSPHVGNLDFRGHFTAIDNSPFYNTCKLYRVYNLNDPVARIPFGFDDPNVLAVTKGPSGLDDIDYCHIGVPIQLHQHTLPIPNQRPDFIVETPKDLAVYLLVELAINSHVGNLVEWVLGWENVFKVFLAFCREMNFSTGSRLAVDFLETASLMINHAPSTYSRNLSIKADVDL